MDSRISKIVRLLKIPAYSYHVHINSRIGGPVGVEDMPIWQVLYAIYCSQSASAVVHTMGKKSRSIRMVAIQIVDFLLMGVRGTKEQFMAGSLLYQRVDHEANRSVRAQFSIDKSGIRFSTKL